MSKSLQKGIIFAVCILLVCALGVTLFIFDGTGGAVTGQEGQASNVAQNTTTYTHGSNIDRQDQTSGTPVNNGTDFVAAVSKDQDISITGDFELTSAQSFLKKDNNGNISDDPATSGTALVYSGTIYGNGYNITITGSQDISNNSAVWDCGPNGYGDAANVYGGLVGKLTGQIYDLNVTMKSGTMEKIKGNDGGDRWLDVGVIAGIVDDVNARIENCSVTIPANTQITALKSPISNVGWGQSSAGTQYVRAAGIAAELNNGTIVNCTVTNNGCISAGLQENKDDNSITNGYYGAAANAVAWVNNGTLNNIIVKGSGKLIGLKTAAISVVNNSNISPTTNAYNGYTGTYEFRHGDDGGNWSTASMYVSGARQAIANFYQASNATTRGGTNKDQTSHELANSGTTLTVNPSTYTIYFDPKQGTNYGNSLAIAFNQAPAAAYKYTLVSGNGNTYENYETTSSAIVFRKLPTDATIWKSGNNFTAELKSESVGPQHRQPALQPYEHGYATSQTSTGTPINSGSKFEGLFSRTGTVEAGDTGTYYLTDDIVITGFTGKQFAGTLDGNGHTIYIAASDTSLAGHTLTGYNGNAVGGVIGALSGTIKNVRVVIDANITVGLNANLRGRVGGVVGRLLNGGSIENVQVIIPGDITLSYTNAGVNDVSMGAVVGQATGASTISGLTVQMDGTLAPVGSYVWVSAVVGEIQAKSDHADTVSMNNIIVRGSGTFAAVASEGTKSGEPPYVSALATFNNGENYPLVNLDGLIYDFAPTFSADGSAMYGLFVNNDSDGNTANYGNYVADSNLFIMQGREYTPTKTGTQHAGNTYIPLDSKFRTINNTVDGLTSSSVAAYFEPGSTNLLRVQVSATWGTERLTVSGITDDNGTPLMTSLVTAGDSSSDRFVRLTKEKIAALTADDPVKLVILEYVSDPALKTALTYTGSALTPEITLTYKGAQLNKDTDYEMGEFAAVDGTNAKVDENGLPLNAGKYTVTITLKGADHWFAPHGSGGDAGEGTASKTATFEFEVAPKNVTMQDPGDSMTAVYGEKYWILSDNNVWGLDENLFFDEEVGNVEYTATVTRTDDGEGYASASGWLKAGSYIVALTINDSNYAINGNASVTYPLTITPVGLSYTLTVENSVAAVYDGNVRTISGTPQGGDGIIGTALEGSAGTAGDSVTAAVAVMFGDSAAQIQNAGDYVLSVTLSGDDAENYTAVLTASWSDGGTIENNTITVAKRSLDLQWNFDSNVALEYGDAITDELIAETQLAEAIPYNGGSYTGSISFTVISATYNGGTAYAPGVAAGTYVTFEVAPVLPDELDENNYNISLSAAGGETKMVGQRTLTVDYDAFAMTAAYGDSISNEWLTEQYKEQIAQSITNIYNDEDVTFKIILHSRNSGGGYTEIKDFSALEMDVTYMAAVVVDGNDNYTIPNSLSNGYDFTLTAREITLSGITWEEEGFDGVYDGKEHALKAVLAEGSSIKEGDEGVLELSKTSLTAVSDGGMITVTVASTFADKYTLTGTTSFNVTLDQKTLTISSFTADFLDYESSGSLYTHLTNKDSGLITGVIDGDTITFSGVWATTPATAEGTSYVAAGSYTLNMNAPGNANYKFENNAMSVTINALDIGGAEVTWNESGLTYTAEEQSVSLDSVTVNGVTLPVDWFNLANNKGTDAKTYTANIAANNPNITGGATEDFTIAPYSVTVKWEVEREISVGTAMPETATDMDALGLTAKVTEFKAPGITDSAQYSIVVTASGFEAGHTFVAGENVTLTPSMNFGQGVTEDNYDITFDPATITKTVAATPVTVKPVKAEQTATYGSSVMSAEAFINATYFTIESGAEGTALTADNFTVTVTDSEGEAVFGTHGLAAGTYTVTIEGKGAYSVSNEDNSFTYTVSPITLTEGTWSGVDNLTYNSTAAAPVFTPEGVLDGDSVKPAVTVTGDKVTEEGLAINAGTYTATATSDNTNYVFDGTINVKEYWQANGKSSPIWI